MPKVEFFTIQAVAETISKTHIDIEYEVIIDDSFHEFCEALSEEGKKWFAGQIKKGLQNISNCIEDAVKE